MNEELTERLLETHEKRLNEHGERLDGHDIQLTQVRADVGSVCKELRLYSKAVFWFIGTLVVSVVATLGFCVQYIITR